MGETIITNSKVYRDYELSEKLECGIELAGSEVKSLRANQGHFKDSFALIEREEVLLYNMHIEPYAQASYMNPPPDRKRKLLLHKKQIRKLSAKLSQGGCTLVPTKMYFNDKGKVKVEIAIGKGKRQYDKRETIKKRDTDREVSRAMKNFKK